MHFNIGNNVNNILSNRYAIERCINRCTHNRCANICQDIIKISNPVHFRTTKYQTHFIASYPMMSLQLRTIHHYVSLQAIIFYLIFFSFLLFPRISSCFVNILLRIISTINWIKMKLMRYVFCWFRHQRLQAFLLIVGSFHSVIRFSLCNKTGMPSVNCLSYKWEPIHSSSTIHARCNFP